MRSRVGQSSAPGRSPAAPRPLVGVVVVLLALGAAPARADDGLVSVDTRWAAAAPGALTLVRGAHVPAHLDVLLGLDLEYLRRPLVVTDRALGARHDVVGSRLGASLVWGVGLFDSLELSLGFPIVLSQAGDGRSVLTGLPSDELQSAVVGDLRLGVAWALPRGLRATSAATFVNVSLPTGTETSLAGEPGVVLEVGACGELHVGPLRVLAELALRARGRRPLGPTEIGTQIVAASAVSVALLDRRLDLALEARGLAGVDPGTPVPLEVAVSARGRPGEDRMLELSLSVGAGLDEAALSPALRVVAGLRYTSPSRGPGSRDTEPAP